MKRIGFLIALFLLILSAGLAHAAGPAMESTSKAGVINVNTASEDQLRMLPLIDEQLAKNIIEYRNSNGPFKSVEDLKNVKGMSKARLDQIRQYLVLSGDTTFNPSMYKQSSPKQGMDQGSSPMTNPN